MKMKTKEIMKLTSQQIDDELFREIDNSWDRKLLINYVIESLSKKEKINWIKDWFKDSD